MSFDPTTIRRGKVSDAEKAQIAALAERFSPGRIAQKLNRHPSTVNWQMILMGIRSPKPATNRRAYQRNGVTVQPFTADEDLYIETLRTAGHPTTVIAKACTARFGHRRSPHTIHMRLLMLANREDGEAAE
jgi:hypothetical protein